VITDAGRDKGNLIRKLQGWKDLDWRPVLLYKANAADVGVARKLLPKQNPVPDLDPSWDAGDTFYILHRTARVDQQNALITALNHGTALEDYLRVTGAALSAWQAAGGHKFEPYNTNFRPNAIRSLPPCLAQHVVPLPGTSKVAVAERHLRAVLEALSVSKFPYPVIEFAGLPVFSKYQIGTPGWNGKPGKLPQAQKTNTVEIEARVLKPGEPGPITGAGNITPSLGMTAASLDNALNRNIALVRYYPLEEARGVRDARIAPFVADLTTDLAIAQSEIDAEREAGLTSQPLVVEPPELPRPKTPWEAFGSDWKIRQNWQSVLGLPIETEFNLEPTEETNTDKKEGPA
jgi:hypothetical protein